MQTKAVNISCVSCHEPDSVRGIDTKTVEHRTLKVDLGSLLTYAPRREEKKTAKIKVNAQKKQKKTKKRQP